MYKKFKKIWRFFETAINCGMRPANNSTLFDKKNLLQGIDFNARMKKTKERGEKMEKIEEILNELYNGKINPNENIPTSEEYKELVKEANKIAKQIDEKLEDKELMDKYIEIQSQISSIDCESKFIEGYKIASQLLISGIISHNRSGWCKKMKQSGRKTIKSGKNVDINIETC